MAPMIPPPLVAFDRRGFLRAVAAVAGSLAGGVALAACTAPPGPPRSPTSSGEPPPSGSAGANAPPRLLAAGRDTVRLGLLVSADGLAADGLRRGVQLYLDQIRTQ